MPVNAQEAIDRYRSGVSGAGKRFTDGVQRSTKPIVSAAVASFDKYVAKLQQSFQDDSYRKGLNRTNDAEVKAAAVAAVGKFTGSAATGSTKFGKFMTVAAPIISAIQQEVDAMPSTTDADNEARALANMRLMKDRLKNLTRR